MGRFNIENRRQRDAGGTLIKLNNNTNKMKSFGDLCISIATLGIMAIMILASYLLVIDVTAKAEGKEFRQRSYLLIEDEKYIVDIIPSKDQCILTNRLRDTRYTEYERFENSCDFIFADANDVHNILKSKTEMTGVITFEGRGHFRYYPLYKGDYGQLEMANGIKSFTSLRVPLKNFKVTSLNHKLRAAGLY